MKLPNGQNGVVTVEKVRDYLLDSSHPGNQGKAAYFERCGYQRDDWQRLRTELLRIGATAEVNEGRTGKYGVKYVVDGILLSSSIEEARIRTVWIVEEEGEAPRLVTAYPNRWKG